MKLLPNLLNLNPIIRRFRNSIVLTLDKKPDLSHTHLTFKETRISLSNSTDHIPHTEDYLLKTKDVYDPKELIEGMKKLGKVELIEQQQLKSGLKIPEYLVRFSQITPQLVIACKPGSALKLRPKRRGLSNPCKKCGLKYHHISHCPFDPQLIDVIKSSIPTTSAPSETTKPTVTTTLKQSSPNHPSSTTNNLPKPTSNEENAIPPKGKEKKVKEENEEKNKLKTPALGRVETKRENASAINQSNSHPPKFPPLHRPMASSPSDTLPPRHERVPSGLGNKVKGSPRIPRSTSKPVTPGPRKTVIG